LSIGSIWTPQAVCKNDNAHRALSEQLHEHSITRKYYAIVYGNISSDEGTVDAPIGRSPKDRKKMAINNRNGRRAVTHYRVLERFGGRYTYIECQLETGRTHQIRVHMASIGHPILGDEVYGPKKRVHMASIGHPILGDDVYCHARSGYKLQGQTLHAGVLGFIHPSTGEYVEFKAELPEYFKAVLEKLK